MCGCHGRSASMEASVYEQRKQELLEECKVAAEIFDRVLPRLEAFMEPFVRSFGSAGAGRARADVCARPAFRSGTQKRGIDCLSVWARSFAAAMVRRAFALGLR